MAKFHPGKESAYVLVMLLAASPAYAGQVILDFGIYNDTLNVNNTYEGKNYKAAVSGMLWNLPDVVSDPESNGAIWVSPVSQSSAAFPLDIELQGVGLNSGEWWEPSQVSLVATVEFTAETMTYNGRTYWRVTSGASMPDLRVFGVFAFTEAELPAAAAIPVIDYPLHSWIVTYEEEFIQGTVVVEMPAAQGPSLGNPSNYSATEGYNDYGLGVHGIDYGMEEEDRDAKWKDPWDDLITEWDMPGPSAWNGAQLDFVYELPMPAGPTLSFNFNPLMLNDSVGQEIVEGGQYGYQLGWFQSILDVQTIRSYLRLVLELGLYFDFFRRVVGLLSFS